MQALRWHYWSVAIRLFSVISRVLVGGVLLFRVYADGVFCCSSQTGPLETLWRGLTSLKRYSRLGYWTLFVGVLPLHNDAVGVFYSPSRLGHWRLFGGVLTLCRDPALNNLPEITCWQPLFIIIFLFFLYLRAHRVVYIFIHIYIYIERERAYIYIYIYMCVCVCVCVI